jgi:hypothetical protein
LEEHEAAIGGNLLNADCSEPVTNAVYGKNAG